MELSKLAKKPELVKVVLDDEETVAEFGEAVEFYTWDRQPMDMFLKLASVGSEDQTAMFNAVKDLVLDKDGKSIVSDEAVLPTSLLLRVVTKIVENLGK